MAKRRTSRKTPRPKLLAAPASREHILAKKRGSAEPLSLALVAVASHLVVGILFDQSNR